MKICCYVVVGGDYNLIYINLIVVKLFGFFIVIVYGMFIVVVVLVNIEVCFLDVVCYLVWFVKLVLLLVIVGFYVVEGDGGWDFMLCNMVKGYFYLIVIVWGL